MNRKTKGLEEKKGRRYDVEVLELGVSAAAESQWFGEEAGTKGANVHGSFQGWCFFCVCLWVTCVCVCVRMYM